MRIALCLTGLLGGLNGRNGIGKTIDPRNGYYWYNKNIFKGNKIDVFIHTWQENDFNLIDLYKPKAYIIEDQINFSNLDYNFYGCESYEDLYLKEERLNNNYVFNNSEVEDLKGLIFRSNSKWNSTHKVIKLKKEYEKKYRFKYDFVIISRFDIALTKKINFYKLNKEILYLSARGVNQSNADRSFNDLIFLGDSKVIDLFAQIYTERNKYSVDPTYACYEHIIKNKINWADFFQYEKNTFLFRWNQNLMKFSPQPYYFIRHKLRQIKRKILNA
tara:strand:- start:1608 stop:2429 length:822 start_codon:yes stop_codon:yes gene_type:complete